MIGYRLKSSANQSMLARELQLYKARFGTKNAILSLVLEDTTPVAPPQASILKTDMPKATNKRSMEAEEDVEAIEKEEMVAKEMSLHGVANPMEAAKHVCLLDQTLENMDAKIKLGKIEDVIKEAVECFREIIMKVVPQVAEANVRTILHSMRDPKCMAIRPQTEEMEQLLEDLMPPKDIPSGSEVASFIEEIVPLTDNQRNLLIELFDDLEVAHKHLGRSCSALSRLLRMLNMT